MGTLSSFIMTTLDGFYEGPNGEFDFWTDAGAEFDNFSIEQLDAVDALVFGHATYAGMANYWPTADAIRDNPAVAERMNTMTKFVASSTLTAANWTPTTVIDEAAIGITELKAIPGNQMLVLGSPRLTASLIMLGLLDELRIMVNPVTIGHGKSLFASTRARTQLELIDARSFRSGNVLLAYRPKG